MMPDQTNQLDLLSDRIAGTLLAGAHGLSLVGPQNRVDDVVTRLLRRLDHARLLPVLVRAAQDTPESLRESASRAHAGRLAFDTVLLLIVPDAGHLTAEMLRELEQAAEAAITPGGIKLLLASSAPLSSILRDAGLTHLHDCLDAHLSAIPDETGPSLPAQDRRRSLVDRPRGRPRPSSRRMAGRVATLAAVLLGLLVAALVLLYLERPARRTPVPPARQIPAPVPLRSPPVMPPPAPVAPAPAPPAPVAVAPLAAPGAPPAPSRPEEPAPGTSPLLLVAQPGDTLPVLYAKVYAGNPPPPYAAVSALNPVITPGTRLVFPAPPGGWRSKP